MTKRKKMSPTKVSKKKSISDLTWGLDYPVNIEGVVKLYEADLITKKEARSFLLKPKLNTTVTCTPAMATGGFGDTSSFCVEEKEEEDVPTNEEGEEGSDELKVLCNILGIKR